MKSSLQRALGALARRAQRYFFFDYDGTLAPIAVLPELAFAHPRALACLRKLARLPRTRLGVVTGRSHRDIRRLLPRATLDVVATLHGLHIEGPGFRHVHSGALKRKAVMRRAASRLRARLRGESGVIVEDKQFTVAVHFRKATARGAARAERESRRVAQELAGLRCLSGKKVLELRPDVDWDKGRAIDWILRRFEGPRWLERRSTLGVLYVGDDQTDEEAFRRLRSKAVTVRVGGRGPTAAAHRVLGTKQVVELMEMLVSLATESAR